MKSMKNLSTLLILIIGLFFLNTRTYAHCEVPCGIYDDSVRVALIYEHITTIEKAMKNIVEISSSEDPNYNQLVRWIMNKEKHATEIQEIVSQYFLTQRIKLTDDSDAEKYTKYITELSFLHEMTVFSMKTKQTTDSSFIEKLRSTVASFEKSYFQDHKH